MAAETLFVENPSSRAELDRLRSVLDVQRRINAATLDSGEVLKVCLEAAQRLTKAEGGAVELAEGDRMVYRAVSGTVAGSLGTTLQIGDSLSGHCVRGGISLRCDDTEADPRVDRAACRRIGVGSMIVVPLIHEGFVVGVLKVVSRRPRAFQPVDVETLEMLSGFVATSLCNASSHQQVNEHAMHDGLTGLPNRRLLIDRMAVALRRAQRDGTRVRVSFLDLDGFKAVNDSFGHALGDRLLVAVGQQLVRMVREEDTVARLGGDEFVILWTGHSESQEAVIRDRIKRAVDAACDSDPAYGRISVSVGHAVAAAGSRCPLELLATADAAMYREKSGKRGAPRAYQALSRRPACMGGSGRACRSGCQPAGSRP